MAKQKKRKPHQTPWGKLKDIVAIITGIASTILTTLKILEFFGILKGD